jgi:uncharacterized protein (DUF1800 family)
MSFDAAPVELRYDRVRLALEMLAAHPSTAEHVCRDLIEHYVRVPAPETMVKDLAAVFHETGGDLRRVLLAMSEHAEFRRAALPPKVARPIDFALRVSRATRADDAWPIVTMLQSSGTGLFECVTPNGYPEEDDRYADSNALLQRWKLVRSWEWRVASLTPGPWRWQAKVDQAAWAQNVVDAVAVRLTGRVLGEQSNAAALDVLLQATGDRNAQTSAVAMFIGTLPEASLR